MNSVEVTAARNGQRVLYIAANSDERRAVLETAAEDGDLIASIRRTNGNEQIRYVNGGGIYLPSMRGARGYSADIISMIATDYRNEDILGAVLPCLATSTEARIVIRP